MRTAWLARIDAQDSGGSAVTARLATHNDAAVTTLDGATWWPTVAQLPIIRHDFFDGAFGGAVFVPSGTLTFRDTLGIAGAPQNWLGLRWAGARIRMWRGDAGAAFGSYSLTVDARVAGQPVSDGGVIAIDVRPDDRWLDGALLPVYGGTGGADGPDALAGQVKPLCLGAPRFAPATLIDADNLVWQLSAWQIEDVELAFDRLARFGASSGDHASYAALIAASVPDGGWATCRAAGLVRHGAPHDGTPGWHVRGDKAGSGGWVRKPGAILSRIAEIMGVTAHATSMAALDSARPWNMSFVLRDQVTPRALVQQIAGDVAAACGVDWLGQFWARPLGIGSAALTLRADGSSLPPVASVQRTAIAAPFHRLATRAEVTHAVVDAADAAYDYIYRGAYNALRVYRADDVVTLDDGSMWRFVGATPLAGSTPAAGNANWVQDLAAVVDQVPPPTQISLLPPSGLPEGGIWFRSSDMRPHRNDSGSLLIGADTILFEGDDIYIENWVDVQDNAVPAAQAAADAALATLTDIASDNLLTPGEKPAVILERDVIIAEQTGVEASATANGVTTEKTAYSNAIAALTSYLAGLTSPVLWSNLTGNTTIVGATFRSKFSDVYTAKQALLNKIAERVTTAQASDLTGNFAWAIAGDFTGAVTTSLPVDRRFKAMRGGVDVSTTTGFALSDISPALALTVNNTPSHADRGVVTMGTGTTGGGTAVLTATFSDGAVVMRTIAVTKTNAAAPATGGSGSTFGQDTTFNDITGTSHVAISDEIIVRSDGSGNVRIAIDLYYEAAGSTSVRTPAFKAAYATTSGGSLTDLFSEATGSSCAGGTEPYGGSYTRAEATFAMPASNTDYYFKLLGRRASGSGNMRFTGNSFTVRQ